jgi:hypothetical protein
MPAVASVPASSTPRGNRRCVRAKRVSSRSIARYRSRRSILYSNELDEDFVNAFGFRINQTTIPPARSPRLMI